MKSYIEVVNEGKKDYEIYHDTFTSAAMEARAFVKKNGYSISDEDDWNHIATGPGKPKKGKTNRYNIPLSKGDKNTKRMLAMQVYNRETDKKTYELNMYIS